MGSSQPVVSIFWVFFGWRGRLSRQSYMLGAILMVLIQVIIIAQILLVDNENEPKLAMWGLILFASWIVSAYCLLAMTAKRLHDLDMPGMLTAITLLPGINSFFVIAMAVLPGSQNTNEHGPPPFPRD